MTTTILDGNGDPQVVSNIDDLLAYLAAGWTPYSLISAASTNATSLKAGAGKVLKIEAQNYTTGDLFLKVYDKASAPNPASDTPKMRICIPPTVGTVPGIYSPAQAGAADFSLGIAFLLTDDLADTDATGVGANEVVLNILYS